VFVAFQVRECTTALLHVAKKNRIPIFLVGHVTKGGDIAGPRVLEHLVDCVLYMEGERQQTFRLIRGIKNRFGATDEVSKPSPPPPGCWPQDTRDCVLSRWSMRGHVVVVKTSTSSLGGHFELSH